MSLDPPVTPERQSIDGDSEVSKLVGGENSESFVRDNIGWMLATARRILRDDARAEDCVQEAFSNIFVNLESFRGDASIRSWMHRIVVNQALMALRTRKKLNETPIDDLLPDFDAYGCRVEEPWTVVETPEKLLEQSQTRQFVLDRIDALPEAYRVVLLLRDIEEVPTAEVAAMLGLSETNVKVRLHRARAALKKLLEPLLRGQIR